MLKTEEKPQKTNKKRENKLCLFSKIFKTAPTNNNERKRVQVYPLPLTEYSKFINEKVIRVEAVSAVN